MSACPALTLPSTLMAGPPPPTPPPPPTVAPPLEPMPAAPVAPTTPVRTPPELLASATATLPPEPIALEPWRAAEVPASADWHTLDRELADWALDAELTALAERHHGPAVALVESRERAVKARTQDQIEY